MLVTLGHPLCTICLYKLECALYNSMFLNKNCSTKIKQIALLKNIFPLLCSWTEFSIFRLETLFHLSTVDQAKLSVERASYL